MGNKLAEIIDELKISIKYLEVDPHIADYTISSSGEKKYKIGLYEILKTLIKYKDNPNNEQRQKQTIEKWKTALLSANFSSLTKKDVRIICGVSEIIKEQEFINFIYSYQQNNPLSSRMIRSLVQSYHSNWNEHPYKEHFESLLLSSMNSFSGNNKTILLWKNNLDRVIGASAPNNIANEVIHSLSEPSKLCEKYSLFSENTPFFKDVLKCIAISLCAQITNSTHYDRRHWTYIFENILKHNNIYKDIETVVEAISSLIEFVDTKVRAQDRETAETQIKDFLLTHDDFKDPRLNVGKWHYFDQSNKGKRAKEIIISWLSKEDIDFFFELIIKNDPHGRKPFWLKYLKKIKGSRVVIGSEDRAMYWYKLKELREKGRTYSSGDGLNTSAFILRFDNYVVVEFSRVGNACYVYDHKTFERLYGSLYQAGFNLKSLKDPSLFHAEHKESHSSDWQYRLRNKLASLGIRVDYV